MSKWLCLECGGEVSFTPESKPDRCPHCGDNKGIPADLEKMLNINISEHELRILTIWADNLARMMGMEHITGHIIDRLSTQTDIALSLSQEVADIRAANPDAEVHLYDNSGNEIDI